MQSYVSRLVRCLGVLCATVVLSGAGAGIAGAEPDDPPDPGPSSEPGPTGQPGPPRGPLDHLRDALNRPRSIFGNGRPPVQLPKVPNMKLPVPRVDPGQKVPEKKLVGSGAEIALPGAPPVSVPVPTIPGTSERQWSINLTDPGSAYTSVQDTLANLNGAVSEALAPYNPRPKPTLKITEEQPVIDTAPGAVGAVPKPDGSSEVPVLQAPTAFPAIKLGPPRPLSEVLPAGGTTPVLAVGTAGVRAPEGRSVTQGSVQAGETVPGSATAPMSNTAYRQGFPQYLRTARVGELAVVAVPGVAGLLAITASGGVIGFRQANSGRYLRSEASRFLQ
ncbi:MAG TPA: hypothetical protein VF477_01315 [Mycobacterium sp.]